MNNKYKFKSIEHYWFEFLFHKNYTFLSQKKQKFSL